MTNLPLLSIRSKTSARLLLLGSLTAASAQQHTSPATTEVVDIGVQLNRLDGTPIQALKPEDFQVLAATQHLSPSFPKPGSQLSVTSPIPTTRLLVIFPTASAQVTDQRINDTIRQLSHVWPKRWEVAFLTPSGFLTPYETSQQSLEHDLSRTSTEPKTHLHAIETLSSFPGRRVLIVWSNGSPHNLYVLRRAAREAQAMLYEVGASPWENYTYGPVETTTTGSLPVSGGGLNGNNSTPGDGFHVDNNTVVTSATASPFITDMHAERSIRGAIHDALRDAGGYYTLRVEIPSGTPSLSLSLSPGTPDYRVTAVTQTSGKTHPPKLILLRK